MAEALLRACPLPSDPDRALAEWLQSYAAEALDARKGGAKTVPRSEPPPAGRPTASDSRRLEPQQPLFAAVPPPRRALLKVAAAAGAIAFLALPLALILGGPKRTRELLHSAIAAGPAAAHGDLRVTSRPAEAEVYVDGSLRGVTPLIVELPAGTHAVRVGSLGLARWRALDVQVKRGVEVHLDVKLAE
jgi:hypothetical protein